MTTRKKRAIFTSEGNVLTGTIQDEDEQYWYICVSGIGNEVFVTKNNGWLFTLEPDPVPTGLYAVVTSANGTAWTRTGATGGPGSWHSSSGVKATDKDITGFLAEGGRIVFEGEL